MPPDFGIYLGYLLLKYPRLLVLETVFDCQFKSIVCFPVSSYIFSYIDKTNLTQNGGFMNLPAGSKEGFIHLKRFQRKHNFCVFHV